jgi:hypothetical protein
LVNAAKAGTLRVTDKEVAMQMKLVVAALAIAASVAPALARSGGCNHEKQASMSCAAGQSWDAVKKGCVTPES